MPDKLKLPAFLRMTPRRLKKVRKKLAETEALEEERRNQPLVTKRHRKRRGHKSILKRLGYTPKEIKAMSPTEASWAVARRRKSDDRSS